MLLVLALGTSRAQDSSSPQSPAATPDTSQQPETPPAPAFGQENPPPPVSENPPISGIDQPGLEPHAAPLSYLQPIRSRVRWAASRCSDCGVITNSLSTSSAARDITARTVSASSK